MEPAWPVNALAAQAIHASKPAAAGTGDDVAVHGPKALEEDLTKISYRPFLPVGDTQSIDKK
jgi:hypothetical protein